MLINIFLFWQLCIWPAFNIWTKNPQSFCPLNGMAVSFSRFDYFCLASRVLFTFRTWMPVLMNTLLSFAPWFGSTSRLFSRDEGTNNCAPHKNVSQQTCQTLSILIQLSILSEGLSVKIGLRCDSIEKTSNSLQESLKRFSYFLKEGAALYFAF